MEEPAPLAEPTCRRHGVCVCVKRDPSISVPSLMKGGSWAAAEVGGYGGGLELNLGNLE